MARFLVVFADPGCVSRIGKRDHPHGCCYPHLPKRKHPDVHWAALVYIADITYNMNASTVTPCMVLDITNAYKSQTSHFIVCGIWFSEEPAQGSQLIVVSQATGYTHSMTFASGLDGTGQPNASKLAHTNSKPIVVGNDTGLLAYRGTCRISATYVSGCWIMS
jgi:hypothetical protein